MAKTQEELKELKQEYESLTKKFEELSQEEIDTITGGTTFDIKDDGSNKQYEQHFYKEDQGLFNQK